MTRLTIICITAIIVSLTLTEESSADIDPKTILGIWLLDEGNGDTAKDASGNGHDGTLMGSPDWIAGKFGSALSFRGSSTYVDCGNDPTLNVDVFSVSFWCNIPSTQGWNHMVSRGSHVASGSPGSVNWGVMMYDSQQTILYETFNNTGWTGITTSTTTNEWHHVVATFDGGTGAMQLYHDGQLASSGSGGVFLDEARSFVFGARSDAGGAGGFFNGRIDEVGYFNAVLAEEDIQAIMVNGLAGLTVNKAAGDPHPALGEIDVQREPLLSWTPGQFANTHDVYFGMAFGDVNDASRTNPLNILDKQGQSETTYEPGRLAFDTTYYWRVDEVNAPPDNTIFKGDIWYFTTEPIAYPVDGASITATASSVGQADSGPEKTIDGSGLNANNLHSTDSTNMWVSGNEPQGAWIQYEFDKVYKLHEMWIWNSNQIVETLFGFGLKDVTIEYSTNGTDWTALGGVTQFAKAPGMAGYAHDTTVDLGGATAKYIKLTASSNWGGILPQYSLSEVRFFYIPLVAREPSPATGAANVDPDATFTWRAGREAATHNVYVSTDEQAVIDGTVTAVSVTDANYSPDLDLGSTYYWRIDEVNDAETPITWQGETWSFTTPDYLVVDDFESYNDIDPPDPASHRIFESWIDGYDVATNGALVGNDFPPYLEQTIVHGGTQSVPVFYSNTAGAVFSEITRTFSPSQDWTKHGIQTLVLYVQGTPGNTGQLYVKVNGVKVPYPGAAADMALPLWNQWNIDLASLGVNFASVTSLAVGIDGNGAAGTLYVDDFVLYRSAPPQPTEQIYLEAEAGTITAPLTVRDDPSASGGQYIGTDDGIGDENNNPPADGIATYNFTSQGGVYKISLRVIITGGSNSFWVRIPGATSYAPGTHTSGWIRFNDISDGAAWHWDDVHSNDHNNEVVTITVLAGPQTLEIARREDGALLDAIVISKID